MQIDERLERKYDDLKRRVRSMERVAVTFSGALFLMNEPDLKE